MDWKQDYPDRYYACPDATKKINGFPVVTWVDIGFYSVKPSWLPDASNMVALTKEQYDARAYSNQVIKNGAVATEIAVIPQTVVSLKDQAAAEVSGWIQSQINEVTAMGETFTDAMKAYVKAVRAIASGADTTSTELPKRPAEGEVAAS